MDDLSDELLRQHDVLVASDNPFQRRARLLQALWREARELPRGERRDGAPLGSALALEYATTTRVNLMTEVARAAAQRELDAKARGSNQVIQAKRLWANLLSSQPLAFNLFADLAADLGLATSVLRGLWPDRVAAVSRIAFEYSPGRSDPKYTDDKTAFDVYVEHTTPRGGRGFIGIEVKYHEALGDDEADHRPRYDEVTRAMGCFKADRLSGLKRKPIEQIWRDHMLAGSMLLDRAAGWEDGLYVFLYPEDNERCRRAAQLYADCLADPRTFEAMTLERVVAAIIAATDATWIRDLSDRYLNWEKLDDLVESRVR